MTSQQLSSLGHLHALAGFAANFALIAAAFALTLLVEGFADVPVVFPVTKKSKKLSSLKKQIYLVMHYSMHIKIPQT